MNPYLLLKILLRQWKGFTKVHDNGNIHLHTVINKGDIEKGFKESDLIIENEYRTGRQEHAYLVN